MRAFLEVALAGKLMGGISRPAGNPRRAGKALPDSSGKEKEKAAREIEIRSTARRNKEDIDKLEHAISAKLIIGDGNGSELTEDGEILATLLLQLADFIGACSHKPYVWSVGGADPALQWLVSPILPQVQEALLAKAVSTSEVPGMRHRKPVVFSLRDVRSHLIPKLLHHHQIHFCVTRLRPELQNKKFRLEPLGEYEYKIYARPEAVIAAQDAAKKANEALTEENELRYLRLAVTSDHRIRTADGSDFPLKEFLAAKQLKVAVYCESAIQAANLIKYGYAALLPSYYSEDPNWETYDLDLPKQPLVLVAPANFARERKSFTADEAFKLLAQKIKDELKRAQNRSKSKELSDNVQFSKGFDIC